MKAPSRKWFAAQVSSWGGWLVAAITAGWVIGTELQIMAVGIVVSGATSYLLPNSEPAPEPAVLEGVRR